MKKKLLLFLASIMLVSCLFALAISADEIYSDYTKEGANGEDPLFTPLGYAIDEENGCICVEYQVDKDALSKYEAVKGTKIKYGIIAALGSFVENGMPIDASGKAIGANASKIVVANLVNHEERIIVRVTGLTPEQYSKELVLNLFVIVDGNVYYIDDSKTVTKTEKTVSYNSIKGPVEVTVNGVQYTTKGETAIGSQRAIEMAESKAVYNTVAMSDSDARSITTKANLVITGGSLLGWDNAAKLMQHFMNGTGEQYNLDMKAFLQDSITRGYRDSDINNALRGAEALALVGQTLDINQKDEYLHRASSGDWYYAVNYYYSDVDVLNLTVTVDENGVKTYKADIRYIVQDYYNWNKDKTSPVVEKKIGFITIKGPSEAELYSLHAAGRAQEFLTYGEITYSSITWTEGQTVDQIAGLN